VWRPPRSAANIERYKNNARNSAAGTDQALFEKLVENAVVCRQAGKSELSLKCCYEVVACVEMNRKSIGEDNKMIHAFALSNLASSLHIMGHCRAAKTLYEQAHNELSGAPRLGFACCMPDARNQQLDYIASRAVLATEGRIPDPRAYLDGDGVERTWSDAEVIEALPRAGQVEVELDANKPPPLNMGSLTGAKHKSYPITSTPRKELW